MALQLAHLWLQKEGRDFAQIVRFTGASAELAEYLTEQVFQQLAGNELHSPSPA